MNLLRTAFNHPRETTAALAAGLCIAAIVWLSTTKPSITDDEASQAPVVHAANTAEVRANARIKTDAQVNAVVNVLDQQVAAFRGNARKD